MKIKHTIIIFIIGLILRIIGALFKIMYWPFANVLLMISIFLQVIGVILLLYKLSKHPKVKEFLNW